MKSTHMKYGEGLVTTNLQGEPLEFHTPYIEVPQLTFELVNVTPDNRSQFEKFFSNIKKIKPNYVAGRVELSQPKLVVSEKIATRLFNQVQYGNAKFDATAYIKSNPVFSGGVIEMRGVFVLEKLCREDKTYITLSIDVFTDVTTTRYIVANESGELKGKESFLGWHFCPEWDGLVVIPYSPEWMGSGTVSQCVCGHKT